MFKKILIAEDHEIRNLGVIKTLQELKITDYDFVSYCDEAFEKIMEAEQENNPYDLLITDLSFDTDFKEQKLTSGQELIEALKNADSTIKIIAFSIEKKPSLINDLFKIYNIDAFVSKGRNDGRELKKTIKKVANNEQVIPQEMVNVMRKTTFEFSDFDVTVLNLLAKGYKQKEIKEHLVVHQMKPDSTSAIEKRLNDLREYLSAKNTIEMVVRCKDLGII